MTRITKMTSSPPSAASDSVPEPSSLNDQQHTTATNTTPRTSSSSLAASTTPSSTATIIDRPPSPAGSLDAMSDDEENDYNTITHTEPPTTRGVKLLFCKSKVYVHPTPSARDNVPGYIALLQQKPSPLTTSLDSEPSSRTNPSSADLLLAWIPDSQLGAAAPTYAKVDMNIDSDSPPRLAHLVPPIPIVTSHPGNSSASPYIPSRNSLAYGHSPFAIPLSAIFSILLRPPSPGWWHGSIVINVRGGESFPPLFFHDNECASTMAQKRKRTHERFDPFGEDGEVFWGGDEVMRWVRRYVRVERSGVENGVWLIEPSKEDSEAFGAGALGGKGLVGGRRGSTSRAGPSNAAAGAGRGGGGIDPLMKFVKEAGWNIMEKFSKVTTFTRQAAQDVLDNPRMPPQVRRLLRNPEVQTLQEEFDSARIYLARWAMGIAEQSERERSQRIWTAREVMELENTDVGEFELLERANSLTLEEARKPVTLKEWIGYFDPHTGQLLVTVDEVKERIFHGGLDPDVRKEAWLFLLNVYDWYSTRDERKAQAASLRDAYLKLKASWWERQIDLGGQGEEGEWWREQRGRIEKDVHRTDRNVPLFAGEDIPHPDPDSPYASVGTNVHLEQMKDMLLTYNEYNKDLGYVQGMSDLLAPLYAVLQDDALAFWAFKGFMDRMERNFLRDQTGMRAQLTALNHLVQFMDSALYKHLEKAESTNFFFFFRMLLVWYKREFKWADVLRLWEALWTDYLSSQFHLFVALAILEKHREVIMEHLERFDEVLKYINELSGTMDLESTLIRAEALFKRFQRLVDAVDKKSNFPAPRPLFSPSPSSSQQSVASTGSNAGGKLPSQAPGLSQKEQQPNQSERVITPELRKLLSRQWEPVPHKDGDKGKGKGMGMGK